MSGFQRRNVHRRLRFDLDRKRSKPGQFLSSVDLHFLNLGNTRLTFILNEVSDLAYLFPTFCCKHLISWNLSNSVMVTSSSGLSSCVEVHFTKCSTSKMALKEKCYPLQNSKEVVGNQYFSFGVIYITLDLSEVTARFPCAPWSPQWP